MKKLSRLYFCVIALFATAMLAMTASFAAGDPVQLVESIANQLIEELKADKTTIHNNPSLVYSIADRIVVPHADIAEMSKRVLPPQVWTSASASQKERFETQFKNLLVHTYASALANYNDQTIRFMPLRGGYAGKSTVQVRSQIERPDGPPISVIYRLVNEGSTWKLYDMSVEGVSMLESFRSQFADQLSQGDMDALINRLAQHNGSS